jgi:aspartyl/glutamyl-tRNA(Asn/Gln) amidotransferase C subunit
MEIISKEEVRKIAQISNILVNEAEVAQLQKELTQVLDYAACVTQVQGDAPGLEENSVNITRKDVVIAGGGQEIVQLAPAHEGGYFVVPLIIDQS